MKTFREYLTEKEDETIATYEDYKTKVFDDIMKNKGLKFNPDSKEEEQARKEFADVYSDKESTDADKVNVVNDIARQYGKEGAENIDTTTEKELAYLKAHYKEKNISSYLKTLSTTASYKNFETVLSNIKHLPTAKPQAFVKKFYHFVIENLNIDTKNSQNVYNIITSLIVGSLAEKYDASKDPKIKVLLDNNEIQATALNNIRSQYKDFENAISYKNFDKTVRPLYKEEDLLKYIKDTIALPDEDNPIEKQEEKQEGAPKKDNKEKPPITGKEEQEGAPKKSEEEQEGAPKKSEEGEEDDKKEEETLSYKEIPMNLASYKNELDKIIKARIDYLQKEYNLNLKLDINESVETLEEMFEKTHTKSGEETEAYKRNKESVSKKYIEGQIKKIKQDATVELEKLFEIYNREIITKSQKSATAIKIKQLIPKTKIKLIQATRAIDKKLTQNDLGIAGSAIKEIPGKVVKNIKKVGETAPAQTIKDVAKNVSKKVADTASNLKQQADDAAKTALAGGEGGVVGSIAVGSKKISDVLKKRLFGVQQNNAQSYNPQQAEPTQTQTQQPVNKIAPNNALPNNRAGQAALPPPAQEKTQPSKEEMKKKYIKNKNDEEEEGDGVQASSVDTDEKKDLEAEKAKKVLKQIRKLIK